MSNVTFRGWDDVAARQLVIEARCDGRKAEERIDWNDARDWPGGQPGWWFLVQQIKRRLARQVEQEPSA